MRPTVDARLKVRGRYLRGRPGDLWFAHRGLRAELSWIRLDSRDSLTGRSPGRAAAGHGFRRFFCSK